MAFSLADRWQSLANIQDRYLSTFAAECSQGWAGHEDEFADAALKLRPLGGVDREVFRAIAHFSNEDAQAPMIDWLGGMNLPPDRAELLGTSLTLNGENEAYRVLKTLFHLAAIARVPLILAFDQMEGTERIGPEGLGAFFYRAQEEIVRRKLRTLLDEERRRGPRSPDARAEIAFSALRDTMKKLERTGYALNGIRVQEIGEMQIRGNAQAPGLRVVFDRNGDKRRAYVEVDNALLVREVGFAVPAKAEQILATILPRGLVIWLDQEKIASFAAIGELLNAAATGDVPEARDDAQVLALDESSAILDIVNRAAEAAYSANALPTRQDEGVDREVCLEVMSYLRRSCAMAALPQLVNDLRVPVERVHSAIEALRAQGMVNVVQDRSRGVVVFLVPEAFLESSSDAKVVRAPPQSGVLRVNAGGRR